MPRRMLSRGMLGGGVVAVGAVVVFLSAAADVIGLGGEEGFGYRQIIGVIVGALVTAAGMAVMLILRAGGGRAGRPPLREPSY